MVEGVPQKLREKMCLGETLSSRQVGKSRRLRIFFSMPPGDTPKFYVYILQSLKDFSFYVGQCDDLDRRMSKHNDGFSKYTASKRPLRLVYFEVLSSRSDAIKRENAIKKMKSRKYIEALIAIQPITWPV